MLIYILKIQYSEYICDHIDILVKLFFVLLLVMYNFFVYILYCVYTYISISFVCLLYFKRQFLLEQTLKDLFVRWTQKKTFIYLTLKKNLTSTVKESLIELCKINIILFSLF